MPPLQFWFSGSGLASFLALLATMATLGYGWYRGAITEFEANKQKIETKENRDRTNKVTSLLVAALDESNRLLKTINKDSTAQADKDTADWGRRTHDLLVAAFGESEAALFISNSGYVFYGDGSPASNLRNWVDGRQRRLTELLARAGSLYVKSDFDPSKFR
jgi:hypothetical protein